MTTEKSLDFWIPFAFKVKTISILVNNTDKERARMKSKDRKINEGVRLLSYRPYKKG